MHRRIIQTVYRRMTGDKRACPDEGPHWDTVGFQGNDPRTDLNRSMGMFSLVQVRTVVVIARVHVLFSDSLRYMAWTEEQSCETRSRETTHVSVTFGQSCANEEKHDF